ncbi:MAG: hypothetical protein QXJ75_02910 [Candidatus Bathyarchaeia archaeon]
MKKEYVVTEITAAPDGAPYVLVSLREPGDMRDRQYPAFGTQVSTFRSMDELIRNLGRVLSTQMMSGFATIIKLGLSEYEKLDIKVGDRVALDINKVELVSV